VIEALKKADGFAIGFFAIHFSSIKVIQQEVLNLRMVGEAEEVVVLLHLQEL
jgi:hypothetical protein